MERQIRALIQQNQILKRRIDNLEDLLVGGGFGGFDPVVDPSPEDIGRGGLGPRVPGGLSPVADPAPEDLFNVRLIDLIRKFRGGVVDPGPDVGRYASIVTTFDGERVVASYDATNGDLKLAIQPEGSGWTQFVLDAEADAGRFASVAALPDGRVVVAKPVRRAAPVLIELFEVSLDLLRGRIDSR